MRGLRHPYEWGRDHPLVVDGLFAVGLAVLGLLSESAEPDSDRYRDPDALAAVLGLGATLPLVFRRRYPVAVYVAIFGPAVAHLVREYPGGASLFGLLPALYAVAAYAGRRPAVYCLVSILAVVSLGFLAGGDDDTTELVGVMAVFLAAWLLGDGIRVRRAYFAAVEDRAERLERERHAEAQRAVLEERSRIARELHDIVAHSVSVMVVQAGAARRTVSRDPARAVEAIGQIESTGRAALSEMRRLVGVLRRGEAAAGGQAGVVDDPASRLPQPGIEQLPDLLQQCREAGLEVTLRITGDRRSLPSGIQLVVYRIVQEALTNTMQHAGPARAEVELDYGEADVTVSVCDDGRGAAVNGGAPEGEAVRPGHGLTGMQERVVLYGGQFTAGPRTGGGFRVWARLPLTDADADADTSRPSGDGARSARSSSGERSAP